MDSQLDLDALNKRFAAASLDEVLTFIFDTFTDHVVLASSLGLEDQLLTHHCMAVYPSARVFVLDTGRLNQETYDVMDKTRKAYGLDYEVYYPNTDAIEGLLKSKGPNSFYESIENRKECCGIRKTEPLNRVLKTAKAWITGLRQSQSVTRTSMQLFEEDTVHSILKINPLIKWSFEDIFSEVKRLGIPYNALHDSGYPSIGCAPCTRAITPGEELRAGRWWWEAADQKECGLHVVNGKLMPKRRRDNMEEEK